MPTIRAALPAKEQLSEANHGFSLRCTFTIAAFLQHTFRCEQNYHTACDMLSSSSHVDGSIAQTLLHQKLLLQETSLLSH